MENPNIQRRAIGLLVVFATILTLIGMWNLPGGLKGNAALRVCRTAEN